MTNYLMTNTEASDALRFGSGREFWRGAFGSGNAEHRHAGKLDDHRLGFHDMRDLRRVRSESGRATRTMIACRQRELGALAVKRSGCADRGRPGYRRGVIASGVIKGSDENIGERDHDHQHTTGKAHRFRRFQSCEFVGHVHRITNRPRSATTKSNPWQRCDVTSPIDRMIKAVETALAKEMVSKSISKSLREPSASPDV
jgi:hypothetical protein